MRSQLAEAFYNQLTHSHDAISAGAIGGSEPGDNISPRAVEALREKGISADGLFRKQLIPEMIENADKVVLFPTDFMPEYALNSEKTELWDVIDPHYHHDQGMELVRKVRDDIRERVEKMLEEKVS